MTDADGTDAGGTDAAADEGTRADLEFVTIPALLRAAAATHGGSEAVVDHSCEPAVRLTYAELRTRVDELAAAVIGAGIAPGDRVAIWAPNCWEWIVALLGLQSAGAVLVPLNTRYKGIEAADILRRSRARLLFTVEGFLGNEYVSMLRAGSNFARWVRKATNASCTRSSASAGRRSCRLANASSRPW